MVIRKHFSHRIEEVGDQLLQLGAAVEQALLHAMHSLQTRNTTVALWVIQHDDDIDKARTNLEEQVIMLLATQQPVVAQDLRLLTAVSFIATELERIGDYACSIARRVYRAPDHAVQAPLPTDMSHMVQLVQQMLHTSLEAFLQQDADIARRLAAADDEVDALEDKLNAELIDLIHVDVRYTASVVDLLDVVHALERAADRATNIGERVIYLVTNVTEDLNP